MAADDQDPLERHLPRLVRCWDRDAPGRRHQSVEGTMAMVDVSGFTELSERLARHGNVGAEEVTEVIDTTFGHLLEEAHDHGAHLLKFGGDALLLLFRGAGHVPRAVAGAHAMRARLRRVGAQATRAGNVVLQMSVGVHTGAFDMWLVGESHREFVVAGPDATRTVQMESGAAAGQVLLSARTAAALPAQSLGARVETGVLLAHPPAALQWPPPPVEPAAIDLTAFVPAALRSTLAGSMHPEHRPATVGFVHFGGIDDVLARHGPDAAANRLDAFVSSVQDAADAHGVTFLATDVADNGGKVILATGVPHATGNDAERMLLALRQVLSAEHGLAVRAGVNAGHLFTGLVGSPRRRTYTVMGDVVNVAARLMAAAGPGELYVADHVLASSRTTFAACALPPLQLRGKSAPLDAVSVGEVTGSRNGAGTRELPLVGRERELAALLADWDRASRGRAAMIGLHAAVGMGKSRLVNEFLHRAQPRRVVRAECRLYQVATPYFPLRALVTGVLDLDDDADAGILQARLARLAPTLQPWAALVGEVVDIEVPPSPEVTELEDRFRPARTTAAIHELLTAAVPEPTVFLVEDCQWMDDSSRELLAGLAGAATEQPWLFALVSRRGRDDHPDGSTASTTDWQWLAGHHELRALAPEDAARLVVTASSDAPLLPHQVDALVERGEGRPLFLLELLAALQQGEDTAHLPRSVEGLIAARVDRLDPAGRGLLRRLAVLGTSFRVEHTAAVLEAGERDPHDRDRALVSLDRFLSVDDTGWATFHNVLIRDAAYEGLPFRTRAMLHGRVADAILADAGDTPESSAALLSVHYHRARRWEESWIHSRTAGDIARGLFANHDAATFYRRALVAARHLRLDGHVRTAVSINLAEVLGRAGRYDEALETLRRSLRRVRDDQQRAEIRLRRAELRVHKADYSQALRDTAVGLRELDGVDDDAATRLRAEVLALRSTVRMAQQRPRETLGTARDAARHARAAGHRAALARAHANMDWAHFVLGAPDRAVHSEQAVAIYESLGMLDRASDVVNNMAGFAYYQGDWPRATSLVARSRDLSIRAGNEVQAAMTGVNLGELLVSRGRTEEAEPILTESLRVLRAAGSQDNTVNAMLQLARLELRRGATDRAEGLLEQVREQADDLGQKQFAYEAVLHLADCRVQRGDGGGALELIVAATAAARDLATMFGPQRARVVARALVALDRLGEARRELESAVTAAQELGLVYEEALVRGALVDLADIEGRRVDPTERTAVTDLLGELGVEDVPTLV